MLAERLVANLVGNAVRYNIAGGDVWVCTCSTAGTSQLTMSSCRSGTKKQVPPARL